MFDITKARAEGEIVRYGWAQWVNGVMPTWRCGLMFPQTAGNSEVPFGSPNGTADIARQPIPSLIKDPDAQPSYLAYVTSKAWDLDVSLARRKRITEAYVAGAAEVGGTVLALQQLLSKDWGLNTVTEGFNLTPTAAETRVRKRIDSTDMSDFVVLQVQLGDQLVGLAAANKIWTLDRWVGMLEDLDGI
jgi:hypothetical protein